MAIIDWLIVGFYVAAAIGIGVYFTKRASKSTDDYFVAGRSLGWFIAGTSIVATTFSSDTPLVVAGISRQSGISGHWFWLSAAMGQIATVFFFAKLWRRTEAMTDVEFVAQRYEPSPATTALRIFKVFFDGVLLNCIVMASVTLAMTKVINVMLDLPQSVVFELPVIGQVYWPAIILFILGFSAVLYSALSGLYGVVYTDLLQFILAMTGSIGLAIIVYIRASADNIITDFPQKASVSRTFLDFFPSVNSSSLAVFTFFVYIFLTWWHRVPGNGYYVQRLLATRSERDSVLAFLWFNICQYVIRPWPWIIVGLFSLYYLPGLTDHESSFPEMINMFLPTGLKGIMVASMLAAFMSTIDTHLNWGTSYMVNDFYKPFINSKRQVSQYIFISRILMLSLMITALLLASKLTSILAAYKYLSVVFGGIATVMIARWYWWRINPWSEISAIIASLVVGNLSQIIFASSDGRDMYAVRLVVTILAVTSVWITVTYLTSVPKPTIHLIAFYQKMKIPGPGWKKVRDMAGCVPEKSELLISFTGWISCCLFIYSLTLGIGKLLFHHFLAGFLCLALSILSGTAMAKVLRKMKMFNSAGRNDR
ncbi:MAG: sodium:solute symporter family protein [Planctomycetota bacterium]|jgi:SSS family solute:Na+ symporter